MQRTVVRDASLGAGPDSPMTTVTVTPLENMIGADASSRGTVVMNPSLSAGARMRAVPMIAQVSRGTGSAHMFSYEYDEYYAYTV